MRASESCTDSDPQSRNPRWTGLRSLTVLRNTGAISKRKHNPCADPTPRFPGSGLSLRVCPLLGITQHLLFKPPSTTRSYSKALPTLSSSYNVLLLPKLPSIPDCQFTRTPPRPATHTRIRVARSRPPVPLRGRPAPHHGVDLLHRASKVGSLEAGGAEGLQKCLVIYAAVEVVTLHLGALGRQGRAVLEHGGQRRGGRRPLRGPLHAPAAALGHSRPGAGKRRISPRGRPEPRKRDSRARGGGGRGWNRKLFSHMTQDSACSPGSGHFTPVFRTPDSASRG